MLKRCVAAEWAKLRHSYIWLLVVTLPVISILIGCANYYMNRGILKNEWYSLWSQVGLFYGEFFFPILIAICCAYVWRLEHFQKNWNLIMTAPVSVAAIFLSKWVVVGILLLLVQGIFGGLYVLGGIWLGFNSMPPGELLGWLLRGWIAALAISTLQLALSMRIRSFAVPVGLGLCATFLGLGMYVLDLGQFFPHSLLSIGMGVLSQTSLSTWSQELGFLLVSLLYITIISTAAIRRMRKSDVIT